MLRISLVTLLISLSACSSPGEISREKSQSVEGKSSTRPDTEPLAALPMDAQTETSIPIIANARAELRVLGMT